MLLCKAASPFQGQCLVTENKTSVSSGWNFHEYSQFHTSFRQDSLNQLMTQNDVSHLRLPERGDMPFLKLFFSCSILQTQCLELSKHFPPPRTEKSSKSTIWEGEKQRILNEGNKGHVMFFSDTTDTD